MDPKIASKFPALAKLALFTQIGEYLDHDVIGGIRNLPGALADNLRNVTNNLSGKTEFNRQKMDLQQRMIDKVQAAANRGIKLPGMGQNIAVATSGLKKPTLLQRGMKHLNLPGGRDFNDVFSAANNAFNQSFVDKVIRGPKLNRPQQSYLAYFSA